MSSWWDQASGINGAALLSCDELVMCSTLAIQGPMKLVAGLILLYSFGWPIGALIAEVADLVAMAGLIHECVQGLLPGFLMPSGSLMMLLVVTGWPMLCGVWQVVCVTFSNLLCITTVLVTLDQSTDLAGVQWTLRCVKIKGGKIVAHNDPCVVCVQLHPHRQHWSLSGLDQT